MKTIDLRSFEGRGFHDVYIFIMSAPAINFNIILPRETSSCEANAHLTCSMEFAAAGYAAYLLNQVSTDLSYTVPSAYKSEPFTFCIETVEPEKLADIIFKLVCVYNRGYSNHRNSAFHFESAQYFAEIFPKGRVDAPGYGLLVIAWLQIQCFLERNSC